MSVPTPSRIAEQLAQAHHVLITSHRNPDGDALGSCLALQLILKAQGVAATVWLRDAVPANLAALPGSNEVHNGKHPPAETFDLAVVLECPTPDRSGLEYHLPRQPIINIDHHLGNSDYGVSNWVDPTAPSVGCLVFELANLLPEPIATAALNLLLVTLFTDTGGFRYANASHRAFEVAAALVEAGGDPEVVSGWVYENRTASSLRLLAKALETLRIDCQGQAATVLVSKGMMIGTAPGDTEGIVDHARAISGVKAAALLRETDDGGIKVSLRSKGQVSVEPIARSFGGGGHDKAAGFELPGQDLETARSTVIELLRTVVEGN